jgi:hypothetical protein
MSLMRSLSVVLVRSALAVIGISSLSSQSKSKRHKKTAGEAGGSRSIGTFFQLRSELSTASGVGEPKIAKEEGETMHKFQCSTSHFVHGSRDQPAP